MLSADAKTVLICQGEIAVSCAPETIFSAVLGSCIAACLWDPVARLGGMNHVLLPGRESDHHSGNKYGIFAMEALINELMKNGARKVNLVAKIFGGARTFENALRVGDANVSFVRKFLDVEGIPIVGENTGGKQARRVKFYPESGKARMLLTGTVETADALPPAKAAPDPSKQILPTPGSGDVELF